MSERPSPAARPRGKCSACGKVFGVPDAKKAYRCKACDGSVRAFLEEPPDLNLGGLEGPDPERNAARNLRDVWTTVQRAKVAYGTLAFFHGLGLLPGLLRLLGRVGYEHTALATPIYLSLTVPPLVLLSLAAFRAHRRPILWSGCVAALYVTSFLLYLVLIDDGTPGGNVALRAILPFLLVGVWLHVRSIAPILAQYPNLHLARRMSGQTGALPNEFEGETARERAERRARNARRGEGRRRAIFACVVIVGLAVAGGVAWYTTRPPSLAPHVEAFRQAWNTSSAADLAQLFAKPTGKEAQIERLRERSGWTESLPQAGPAELVEVGQGRVEARHALAQDPSGDTLVVGWLLSETKGWQVSAFRIR